MVTRILAARRDNPEALGFLATLLFACLASVRDVYLGGLLQRLHPLDFTLVAFGLCTLLFFPAAAVRTPESLRVLARHPALLFGVNATSALAWIAFFYALRAVEPSIVQLLFSGVGPLSVLWIERLLPGAPTSGALARGERWCSPAPWCSPGGPRWGRSRSASPRSAWPSPWCPACRSA
jgi:drug/metabolite transporter (DMT)-like permease